MKYKIELLFSYGWDDESEEVELFDTKEAALESIKSHLESVADAVALGYMDGEYKSEDYRIAEVEA